MALHALHEQFTLLHISLSSSSSCNGLACVAGGIFSYGTILTRANKSMAVRVFITPRCSVGK